MSDMGVGLQGEVDEIPCYKTRQADLVSVRCYEDREAMGTGAARDIAAAIRETVAQKGQARMIFAAAPSQLEVLAHLCDQPNLPWDRVVAFHMDDYLELPADAPERFSRWLNVHLFSRVPFSSVHYIPVEGDRKTLCQSYAELLREAPIDILCLGIGVNGHIAFNDPPVADFDDEAWVKVVELDQTCRQQQVDDGCFPTFEDVPQQAVTLTIPCLMASERAFCVVPGSSKRDAVRRTLNDEISTEVPATILRKHPSCIMYLDKEACPNV